MEIYAINVKCIHILVNREKHFHTFYLALCNSWTEDMDGNFRACGLE